MTDDVWEGVSRDEYEADRLLDMQDEADWRAARGDEPATRPTLSHMAQWWASERQRVMGEYDPRDYGWWNSHDDD